MKKTYLKRTALALLTSIMTISVNSYVAFAIENDNYEGIIKLDIEENNIDRESFIGFIEIFDLETGDILETQYFNIEPEIVAFYSAMTQRNQLLNPFSFSGRSFQLMNGGMGTTIWSGSGSGTTNVGFVRFEQSNGAHSVFVHGTTNTLGHNLGGAVLAPGQGARFNIPALTLGYTIRANSNDAISFLGATAIFDVWR